jgi:hypothetical protein
MNNQLHYYVLAGVSFPPTELFRGFQALLTTDYGLQRLLGTAVYVYKFGYL